MLGKTENGLEERAVDRTFGERTRRNCKTSEDGSQGALQFVMSDETAQVLINTHDTAWAHRKQNPRTAWREDVTTKGLVTKFSAVDGAKGAQISWGLGEHRTPETGEQHHKRAASADATFKQLKGKGD